MAISMTEPTAEAASGPIMAKVAAGLLVALAVLLSASASAVTYSAIEDFGEINSGEVPYYADSARGALAIDAANIAYRNRYARAEMSFSGDNGVYELTLTTLKELDGECLYRVSLNGEPLAELINDPTTVDYETQLHVVGTYALEPGDVIAVESMAVSNGLIPENGEFAFARGRWRSLEIEASGASMPESGAVNLVLSEVVETGVAGTVETSLGQSAALSFTLTNASDTAVATQPMISLSMDSSIGVINSECLAMTTAGEWSCALADLAPGESYPFAVALSPALSGSFPIAVTLTADQQDTSNDDNSLAIELIVSEALPDEAEPTDVDSTDLPVVTGDLASSSTTSTSSSGSGGGGASGALLLLLLLAGVARLHRRH